MGDRGRGMGEAHAALRTEGAGVAGATSCSAATRLNFSRRVKIRLYASLTYVCITTACISLERACCSDARACISASRAAA